MAEEYYQIPENPQYDPEHVRKLQNSDPASAEDTFNPLVEQILTNIAAVHDSVGGSDLKLHRLYIDAQPKKTAYKAGETFDPAGMVVKGDYALDGTVVIEGREITNYSYYPMSPLSAGTAEVTVSASGGGVTLTAAVTVEVTKTSVAKPAVKGSYTYNTNVQTAEFDNYDPSLMVKGGEFVGQNAGEYTAIFTLLDTDLYEWVGGSTEPVEVRWTIGKATPALSASPASLTLDRDHPTASAVISTDGDGELSVSSSDDSVATATLANKVVTIQSVDQTSGSATITVSQRESTNYEVASVEITVTAKFVSNTLSENSLATISEISKAGTGDTYWDVGDTYPMKLKGTVGTISLDTTLYVYIVHFNMPNNKTEAENNIIWQGFKDAAVNGKDVALCDWTTGQAFGDCKEDGTKLFSMNHWGYNNYGGWKGCDLRYDILGATSTQPSDYGNHHTTSCVGYDATDATLTSPVANTVLAAMPADWRGIMRLWTRYIDAVGGGSNVDANIKATVDAITLLAEYEVFGKRTYANNYEQNHQVQVTYYTGANSKIRYAHDSTDRTVYVLEASPNYDNANGSCVIYGNGNANKVGASYSCALAPAFKT